jgi:hypothetical protein
MSNPCRGDCNQGRNCYCGAAGDDRYMLEAVGLLACAFVAACVVISLVMAAVLA